MSLELGDFGERGIFPDTKLISSESMRGNDLVVVSILRPLQPRDLGFGIEDIEHGAVVGIPESDLSIRRTSPSGQKLSLERIPGQSLYSSSMLSHDMLWDILVHIP